VLASKLAFVGWGLGCAALDFTGISGHTLLACTVFPMVSYLALGAFKARWRFIGAAVGWLFGGLIGYSRLMVHAHSSSEVLSGLGLGLIITLVFVVLDTPPQRAARGEWLLFGVLALMMTLQFGVKAPGQDMVTRIALRLSGHSAPYLRGHWRNTHCTL
jgi:membrane-associated phospholipid phosphatase